MHRKNLLFKEKVTRLPLIDWFLRWHSNKLICLHFIRQIFNWISLCLIELTWTRAVLPQTYRLISRNLTTNITIILACLCLQPRGSEDGYQLGHWFPSQTERLSGIYQPVPFLANVPHSERRMNKIEAPRFFDLFLRYIILLPSAPLYFAYAISRPRSHLHAPSAPLQEAFLLLCKELLLLLKVRQRFLWNTWLWSVHLLYVQWTNQWFMVDLLFFQIFFLAILLVNLFDAF